MLPFSTETLCVYRGGNTYESAIHTVDTKFHSKTIRTKLQTAVFGSFSGSYDGRFSGLPSRMSRRPVYRQHMVHSGGVSPMSDKLNKHINEECDSDVESIEIRWTTSGRLEPLDIYCPLCGELVERDYDGSDR